MKPSILLIAASALVAPLSAQNEGPGNDLMDLFEKSQREGATDEELMRMLENKVLLELQVPDLNSLNPDARKRLDILEEQFRKDTEKGHFRPLNESPDLKKPGRDNEKNSTGGINEKPPSDPPPQPPRWLVGLVVKPLDPALRLHFDLPEGAGVIVESVMRGGPAAEAGVKTNDIIVTANERKVASLEDLKAAVEKAGSDGNAMNLEVIQRGKRSVVKVTPRGPDALTGQARPAKRTPANRPMIEIQRRLDQQQREIEALRRELRQLRARLQQE